MAEVGEGLGHLKTSVKIKPIIEIKEDTSESKKQLPEYIQETVARVDKQSESQMADFLKGERMLNDIKEAIKDTVQMQVVADLYPEKKEEALTAIPKPEDRKRAVVEKGDWSAALLKTPKEKKRKELLEFVQPPYGSNEKFENEVNKRIEQTATEIIESASKTMESSEKDNESVMIISTRAGKMIDVLEKGRYIPSLETAKGYKSFSESEKRLIDLSTSSQLSEEEYENRMTGIDSRARRYLREIELGIYPKEGEKQELKHPIYAQMVEDEESELARAAQEGYGDVHIRLNKNKIKDRTTFVVGDSINDEGRYNQQLNWADAKKARRFLNSIIDNPNVDWRDLPAYIEAHIMNGVTLENIDEIIFKKDENTEKLYGMLKSNNNFQVNENQNGQVTVKYVGK